MTLIDNNTGKTVNIGDVVVCHANEQWVFLNVIDEHMVSVMWDSDVYDMPTMSISCRAVQLPSVRA